MSSKVMLKASRQKSTKFEPVRLRPRRETDISVLNLAPLRQLGAMPFQTKLTISQPHDPLEQEADKIANNVMSMPDTQVQRMLSNRQEEVMTAQAENISRKPANASSDVSQRIQGLRGGGRPLSAESRSFFEPRFGHDFSKVRIHTSLEAADLARSVQAKAFTVGKNIAFGAGQYQPNSTQGQQLMAHELTHVIQQGASRIRVKRTKRNYRKNFEQNLMRWPYDPIDDWIGTAIEWNKENGVKFDPNEAKKLHIVSRDSDLYDAAMSTKSIDKNYVRLIRSAQEYLFPDAAVPPPGNWSSRSESPKPEKKKLPDRTNTKDIDGEHDGKFGDITKNLLDKRVKLLRGGSNTEKEGIYLVQDFKKLMGGRAFVSLSDLEDSSYMKQYTFDYVDDQTLIKKRKEELLKRAGWFRQYLFNRRSGKQNSEAVQFIMKTLDRCEWWIGSAYKLAAENSYRLRFAEFNLARFRDKTRPFDRFFPWTSEGKKYRALKKKRDFAKRWFYFQIETAEICLNFGEKMKRILKRIP